MSLAYSQKNIDAAIARLPRMATRDVKALLERAEKSELAQITEACDAELARRPIDFSEADALRFEEMAVEVADLDLYHAICFAFAKARPPSREEDFILRWLAANPGGSYQELLKAYGNRDLGLAIGHLVYDRYGCFKKFFEPGQDQSSVLMTKERSGSSVRYTLKPEAVAALRDSGLL